MASESGKFVNASRIFSFFGLLLAVAAPFGFSTAPAAASPCTQNCAPPSGAVLDLDGQPLPVNTPTTYSTPVTYQAGHAEGFQIDAADIVAGESTLTFVFRDDYSYIYFYDVELYDLSSSTPSANLLAHGDFSSGWGSSNGYPNIPLSWTYTNPNPSNLFVAGSYDKSCLVAGVSVGPCWNDGTAQVYDELSQPVKVNSTDTYEISFKATATGNSNVNWSAVSTNSKKGFSGNAVDVLAYFGTVGQFAEAAPPRVPPPCLICEETVPEPSTWAMMLLGFAGLGFLGYRRAKAQAA